MNPFDEFDLDIVKIMNTGKRSTDCGTGEGSSGGATPSGPIGSLSCTCASCTCTCPTNVTACPSACNPCSEDPKCQTLEGRCE